MKTFGIIAIFALTVVGIVEGAFLVRLSSQVRTLNEQTGLRPVTDEGSGSSTWSRSSAGRVAASGSLARTRDGGNPRLSPLTFQAPPPPPSNTAAVTLREALATVEGRQQLRAALDIMKEEDRQEKMLSRAPEQEEKEQKWKDKLLKSVPLSPEEQTKIAELFTRMQDGRRQALEEMKAGLKNAKEADNTIDELRNTAEKEVKTLLGEKRLKDMRDAEKRDREKEKAERRAREAQQQGQPPQPHAQSPQPQPQPANAPAVATGAPPTR